MSTEPGTGASSWRASPTSGLPRLTTSTQTLKEISATVWQGRFHYVPTLPPSPLYRVGSGEFDWKGHIPFPELPRLYNPPEGIIATANNSIADPSYPYYLSALFDGPYRIERIKELLLAKEKLSLDDMVKIQVDTVSLQAKKVIKTLQSDLEEMASSNDSVREFVQRLTQWDGCCHEQSHEAALYHVFYRRLMVNLLEPELGEELFPRL